MMDKTLIETGGCEESVTLYKVNEQKLRGINKLNSVYFNTDGQ